MDKLFTCGFLVPWSQSLAQGSIVFLNRIEPEAPVFDVDCVTRLAGPAFLTQAYVGLTPNALGSAGPVLAFATGEFAGYITAASVTVPGTTEPSQIVFFQMRAWEAAAGATYEEAVASGGKHGASNISPVEARMGLGLPGIPYGLESFCLVPEPGTMTLAGLGMAGLAWLKRKRNGRGSLAAVTDSNLTPGSDSP